MNRKTVLFLVNHDVVIYNFRLEIVEKLLKEGYEVYISSPYGERIDDLIELGCIYIESKISRHGTNLMEDFKLLFYYRKIIKGIQPNVVLTFTIKPNIYGGMASRWMKTPYIANITGLGTAVENKGIMQKITVFLYKIAFKRIQTVFFQNKENQQFFLDRKIALGKYQLIPGSGVNLDRYKIEEYPSEQSKITFLFIGRIMKNKGIEEFVESARIIKKTHEDIEFHIIGFCEKEYVTKINDFVDEGIIKYHGMQRDVRPFIKESSAIVLPSYHEGMANVLLEAAATGRPVLASNIHGCKETFDEGVTGFGFRKKDVDDLVDKLMLFIQMPYEERMAMGLAGRKKMESEFDRNIVVDSYIEEIENNC